MDRSFALPLRRPLSIGPPRRVAIALLAALVAAPALLGSWLWLRDSALVSVEHVQVSGARGAQGRSIEAALKEAAMRMSTLHVRVGQLRAAVAPYPVVRDVRVSAGFPHTLRIEVIEQPPVAALQFGGARTAVAADGAVLGPALLSTSLPLIRGGAGDPLNGGDVHSATARAALAVLGAAPPTLMGWIARVYSGREGLTVAMHNGLLLYFGDATRPHAKWLSAARVLADPSSAGAWYVDVRLPERPAAGLASAAAGSADGAAQVSASDPTAAALAATLAEAVSGAPTAPAAAPAEPTEAAAAGGGTTSGPTETPAAGRGETTSAPTGAPAGGGATTSAPREAAAGSGGGTTSEPTGAVAGRGETTSGATETPTAGG